MTAVVISIATFKRPQLLRELLDSLESMLSEPSFRVCVVDNDPQASAREVAQASSLDVTYVVEPTPGIAAARNRGLALLRDEDDFVVFVDDDERVTSNWLATLLGCQQTYDADVVSGPVVSVFAEDTPRWILRGGFIQRARFETGAPSLSPATNNTLVRTRSIRQLASPRFDERYSMTGGSDTEFFRRMRNMHARMIWCDDAVVFEDVPPSRASFAWIWRRGVREGNVSGRLHLNKRSRVRLAVDGVFRVAYGVLRQLASFIRGRGLQAKDIAYITRGIGWIGVSADRLIVEYARVDTSTANIDPGGKQ